MPIIGKGAARILGIDLDKVPEKTVPPDSLVRWTCLLCGRDKFSRPGHPHNCVGGFRKRFKAEAERRGLDNAWVKTQNDTDQKTQ